MKLKVNWDGVGVAASLLCAIHCAVLPLILTSLPILGIDLIHDPYFEWGMIFLAIGIGVYSLYHGFIKHHRRLLPFILFATGALLLITKQLLHDQQTLFLFLAVPFIIAAHWMNYRLCHKSVCTSEHHKH